MLNLHAGALVHSGSVSPHHIRLLMEVWVSVFVWNETALGVSEETEVDEWAEREEVFQPSHWRKVLGATSILNNMDSISEVPHSSLLLNSLQGRSNPRCF